MKRMNSKRGVVETACIAAGALVIALTGSGVIGAAANGTLKTDVSVVGCKMLGKGADHCNAKYGYTDRVDTSGINMNLR